MKESFWGIFIIILGSIGIVAINLFQNLTVTTDQNYYLLKEVTKAAMNDSIDLSYYRSNSDPRAVRIVEEAFVENLTRRFAESVILSENYRIVIHDVVEYPPKVSLSLLSSTSDLQGDKYKILLTIDSIYEGLFNNSIITKHTPDTEEKYTIIIPPEDEETIYKDGICPDPNNVIDECINGDLRFEGWKDIDMPSATCPEDLDGLKTITREAKYKVCKCGKWSETEIANIDAIPKRDKDNKLKVNYIWIFDKKGPINNIYSEKKLDLVAGTCTKGINFECPDEGYAIKVGNKINIYPNYIPEDAVNRELKWVAENKKISIIDYSGRVYYPNKDYVSVEGKESGKSSVKATSTNGKTDTCKITVYNKLDCPTELTTIKGGETGYATLKYNQKLPGMSYYLSDSKGVKINSSVANIDSNSGIISTEEVLRETNLYYTIEVGEDKTTCPFKIAAYTPSSTGNCTVGTVKLDMATLKIKKSSVCPQMFSKFKNQAADFVASNTSVTVTVMQCGKKGKITSDCKGDWVREEMTFKGKTLSEIKKLVEVPMVYTFNNWNPVALKCAGVTSNDTINLSTKEVPYIQRDPSSFICKQVDNLDSMDGFIDSQAKNVEIKISHTNPSQGLKGISIEHVFTGDAISKCTSSIKNGEGKGTWKNISNGIYSYDAPDVVKKEFNITIKCYLTSNQDNSLTKTITVVPPKDCKFSISPDGETIKPFEINNSLKINAKITPSLDYLTSLNAAWSHSGVLSGKSNLLSYDYTLSGTPTKKGEITVNATVQAQGNCIEKSSSEKYIVCETEPICDGYQSTLFENVCFNESLGISKTCSKGTNKRGSNLCVSTADKKDRKCKTYEGGLQLNYNSKKYMSILEVKTKVPKCIEFHDCEYGYTAGNGYNGLGDLICYKEIGYTQCKTGYIPGPGGKCYSKVAYSNPIIGCKK